MALSSHAPRSDTPEAASVTFQREGWLLVPGLLERAKVEALSAATSELERMATNFDRDTLVRKVFFQVQSASGKKGEPAIFPGALRKITSPSSGQPAFDRLRRDPKVLGAVESCGLPAPRCLIDQVNLKLPRVGSGFPYHQDESFLFGDALRRVQRFGGVNLVIALDPADAENGGFEVLGRTHRGELLGTSYDTSTMNAGLFDESHRVLAPLSPGDALLFHPRLAHGSGPNRSERQRRLITLWFGGGPRT
ncbi:MAG TPA: phytanoyl-CoA dioxygenase family protein [Polyangiaceae bacterium]|nr:phytanoyl-CoA dioxygenase family protein [Polyangiaceae bacterium]